MNLLFNIILLFIIKNSLLFFFFLRAEKLITLVVNFVVPLDLLYMNKFYGTKHR